MDVEAAAQDGAPLVHDELGTNVSYVWKLEAGEVDAAFASAAATVKERYYHPRLIPTAIEPRSILVQSNPATGDATMWSATQIPAHPAAAGRGDDRDARVQASRRRP